MKFYQSRKYDMTWMVSRWLKKNKEALSKRVPALEDLIDQLNAGQGAIEKIRIGNVNQVQMKTLAKQSVRDGFVDVLLELSSMLRAARYKNVAKEKNKPVAKNTHADPYNYSRSFLQRAKADKFQEIAKQIIDASKKTKFINRYGITAGDLKDAETYYKEFTGVKKTPTQKKKEVAKQNKDMNTKLNALVDMLENSIDPLMHIATKDDQEMRMAYTNTRKVLYRGPGAITDQEARYRRSREKKGKVKGEGSLVS